MWFYKEGEYLENINGYSFVVVDIEKYKINGEEHDKKGFAIVKECPRKNPSIIFIFEKVEDTKEKLNEIYYGILNHEEIVRL